MYGAFQSGIGQRIGVQAYRHLAIAMGRKYLLAKEMFRYRDSDREGDREDPEVQAGEILDRQAAHVPDVARRIYAREVGEQAGVIASWRAQCRMSSLAWHRKVLGFVAPRDGSMEEPPVDQGQGPGVGERVWDDLYDVTDDEDDGPLLGRAARMAR